MSTITKERVAQYANDPRMCNVNDEIRQIARIALASLEAEAVHQFIYNNPYEEGYTEWLDCNKDYFNGVPEDCRRILYAAPPAPVSVPDAMTPKQASRAYCGEVRGYRDGWNACRAAMLKGADGNYPVIPDGWVMVPEEPTHEMLEAGDEQFGTYDVYRRMLAAAPQQE